MKEVVKNSIWNALCWDNWQTPVFRPPTELNHIPLLENNIGEISDKPWNFTMVPKKSRFIASNHGKILCMPWFAGCYSYSNMTK